jgi:hypothetical protein
MIIIGSFSRWFGPQSRPIAMGVPLRLITLYNTINRKSPEKFRISGSILVAD